MSNSAGGSTTGFLLQRQEWIEELSAEVLLFEHQATGCPLLAIKNDDSNKTFAVAFNTIPTDSTGVAHILEHSVLMGSKKYPVKDVFGEVNKGGLMTFLNAMTGSDITYYPFATRNQKEYFNLMDVYCDVVFNPLLLKETFEQEGWHYHQESHAAPLQFQGVVFNEMKGAFSDPIRLLFHHIFSGLLPGSTYAHESGGDPRCIPDLSYESFCRFHTRHYHPSNATFFVYGDAPLAEELEFLQHRFLSHFPARSPRIRAELGTPIVKPRQIVDRYGVESGSIAERTYHAVGTRVATASDRERNAAFQIVANILYNSDGSPLKNRIVSSGICNDFGGFYLSSSCPHTIMITYLIGSETEHRDHFDRLYRDTLAEMVQRGLDRDLVISELNKYEFNVREDASKAQRGLDLLNKTLAAFRYGLDPFAALKTEELLSTIREKSLSGRYLEDLISESLLDNPATVTVTLEPDPEKLQETLRQEQQRLDGYAQTLSDAQQERLIARTGELMAQQQAPNDPELLKLLPQLKLADLPAAIDFHHVEASRLFDVETLISDLPTNHITYLDIGFDLGCLPHRFLPLLDLFGAIVTEIGTEKLSFSEFAKQVATCTGGLTHSLNTYSQYTDPDRVRCILWLSLKVLPEYLQQAIDLIAHLLSSLSFQDRNRIREIVRREYAWAEHAAQSEGYNLPSTRVFSRLSVAGRYQEQINGITAYRKLREFAKNHGERQERLVEDLQTMARILFNRGNVVLSMTGEEQEITQFSTIGSRLVEALSSGRRTVEPVLDAPAFPRHEAFITAAEVVFNVQGGVLFPKQEWYTGAFEVLKTYLTRDYLWNTVRQMGGAYGCFSQFNFVTGNIALISYRDPQVRKTFQAFERIPSVIAGIDLSPHALDQLIIGTYGSFDPHQSAAARGATARNEYLSGITVTEKQQRLREITATTAHQLRSFADVFQAMLDNSYRSAIGNREKITADDALFDVISDL
ncbi:insulinase family protein [Desulfofustis limnaeus]|uniref:insulinase family protein n=1 Tax=Desulfofustis limnaeus TaxID=2740163 RepID=UPI0024DF5B4F|nr:insulinase family protein [Desulfofustis limnaeus]